MLLPIRVFGAVRSYASLRLLALLILLATAGWVAPVPAQEAPAPSSGAQVLQAFEHANAEKAPPDSTDRTRRWVMFALGAPLLILLLVTGSLGIAMAVYGKPVYLAHMICAGLSITLAIVHAIVGLVWFRPF